MSNFDLIFQRAKLLLGVILGTGIAIWETLADHAAHPWAFFAAIAFIGLPGARAVEDALRLLSNSGEPDKPEHEVASTRPRRKPR